MQRQRGTNHADWYFFICLTNNRVGADHCSGMYICEEDVFSAIYYQLKIFLKLHAITSIEYRKRKAAFDKKIARLKQLYDEAIDNSRQNYERYILNKIDLPEFRAAQAKT